MDNIYMNCLNNLITRLILLNKNIYSSNISYDIYNVLFGNSKNDKQLFFDFFSNTPSYDKKKITDTCIGIIINRTNILLNCVDDSKINEVCNYIDSNRKIIFDIHKYLSYGIKSDIPTDILTKIDKLNRFEHLLLNSIVINIMKFGVSSLRYSVNKILSEKDIFLNNVELYKNNIIEILNFYIPSYNQLYILPYNGTFNVENDKNIYFIFELIRVKLDEINDLSELKNSIFSFDAYLYYMCYQYLINYDLEFFNKDDDMVKSTLKSIINGGKISIEMQDYLFKSYKLCSGISNIDDQINSIMDINQMDHDVYKLFSSYDIFKYNEKKKKKKAFGIS